MIKKLLFAFTVVLIVASCGVAQKEATVSEAGQHFGDKITANNPITVAELTAKMGDQESIKTQVTGTVESVCKKKGCWANIVSDDGKEVFVKFKDYGFFLPLDCEGRKVVMEGEAMKEVTSVDELRHYAEDEGKSKEEIEAITEPKEELKFMASGVILLKEKADKQ